MRSAGCGETAGARLSPQGLEPASGTIPAAATKQQNEDYKKTMVSFLNGKRFPGMTRGELFQSAPFAIPPAITLALLS